MTKTFKSEYINGAKVKVTKLGAGLKLEYGNGHIYRVEYCDLFDHLHDNMSSFYASEIMEHFNIREKVCNF